MGETVGGQRQHKDGLRRRPGARHQLIQKVLRTRPGLALHAEGHSHEVDFVIVQERIEHRRKIRPPRGARHPHRINGIAERAVHLQDLLKPRVRRRAQGLALEAHGPVHVADERRGPAGDGKKNHPPAGGKRRVDEESRGLHELVDAVHQRHAGLVKQRLVGLLLPGQGAGVGHRGPSPRLGAAELQHHHGFLPGGGCENPAQLRPVLGPLHDAGDDLGLGIVGEILDIVGHLHHGLIAARNNVIETNVAAGAELGDGTGQTAALANQGDAARDGVLGDGEVGIGETVLQAGNAHAARPVDGHAVGGCKALELVLPAAAGRGIAVRKTFGDHDSRRHAGGGGFFDHAQHARGGQCDHHAIRHLGELVKRRVTRLAPHLRVIRIDGIDSPRETGRQEVFQQSSTGAGFGRCADDGYRSRPKQCLEVRVLTHSLLGISHLAMTWSGVHRGSRFPNAWAPTEPNPRNCPNLSKKPVRRNCAIR